jgi:hypothetical protein
MHGEDTGCVSYWFWCPGCKGNHRYEVPHWTFNGNLERPSFTPSLLMNRGSTNPTVPVCHLFMTDGEIRFLNDCTHDLAGKTVPCLELPEHLT